MANTERPVRILLVEGDSSGESCIEQSLAESGDDWFELQRIAQREASAAHLDSNVCDVVFLSLDGSNPGGITAFLRIREINRALPIFVFTNHDDTRLAIKSVQAGAQDYMVKGQYNGKMLRRAIAVGMERHRLVTSWDNVQTQRQVELERLSKTDELTGLFNRRHLRESLIAEMLRADRYNSPLSVLLLDLDHFKVVNDTYGHDAGDKVLAGTAALLKREIRLTDLASRYGGEEFCVVLPETDAAGALVLGERIRAALERTEFTHLGEVTFHVTCSIGVAGYERGILDTV
ncbi:diguanylate cyclase, partial [Candidatus Sumerlaeota bacterium]|nr:diguanylate cyclase [Candidatus Sumerlaeota bacterium]